MIGVFAYLTTHSLKNRLVRRLRRLREPRYLLPTVLSVGWLVFWVTRGVFGPGAGHRPPGMFAAFATVEARDALAFVGSVLMFLWAAVLWLVPSKEATLEFTPAEIHFLFPAPVTRRQVVHYKLMRAQLGILFGALVTSLFWGRGLFHPDGVARLAGFWLLYATLYLHTLGAAFVRTNLIEHGVVGLRRRIVPLVLVGLVLAGLALGLLSAWPELTAAIPRVNDPDEFTLSDLTRFFATLGHLGTSGILGVALAPFAVFPRLILAHGFGEFARWFAWGLALLVLHYLWVVRTEASFEEASVEAAQRKAARVRALRDTQRRGGRLPVKANVFPWRLAPTGQPATAIVWKNLIALVRITPVRALFVLAVFLLAALGWTSGLSRGSDVPWVLLAAVLLVLVAMFAALFGPLFVRNDLREDLFHVDAVKTYPLPGHAIVWGELLAPWSVLAFLQTALLACALGALLFSGTTSLARLGFENVPAVGWVFATFFAAMILLPAFTLAQVALQNAIILLFPAWVALGNTRARGFEASGQRMLTMFGSALVLAVGTGPAVLTGGVITWLLAGPVGATSLVLGALVAAGWIVAEVAVAARFLGGVLERLDPSTAGIEARD